MPGAPGNEPARELGLLHSRVRALWASRFVSVAGDQLARVALTVLVYGRIASASMGGHVYGHAPSSPGAARRSLLGSLADRYPRRP